MEFAFKPNLILDVEMNRPKHWIIIGAGGNGGYFIRDFMRQVALQNARMKLSSIEPHMVTIVDADEVEDKNLVRQNFVARDVQRNKAEVVADRYGKAFGIQVQYVSEYIESVKHLHTIARSGGGRQIVFIGAVDNNKTRKIIFDTWKSIPEAFYIDAGNEEFAGQVVCGFNYPRAASEGDIGKGPTKFYMPAVLDIYPEVGEAQDKLPSELSCAERAVSAPQNIFTNLTAANLIMGFANTILTANSQAGEGLKCHGMVFNTKNTMSFTTRHNQVDLLSARYVPTAEEAKEAAEAPAVKAKPVSKKVPVPAPDLEF